MCYKLFEKYRKSIQNVGKILDFEPKTPQKVLNFLAEPSKKSYLVKNIRTEFNFYPKHLKGTGIWFCPKIIRKIHKFYANVRKVSSFGSKHSKRIESLHNTFRMFWAKIKYFPNVLGLKSHSFQMFCVQMHYFSSDIRTNSIFLSYICKNSIPFECSEPKLDTFRVFWVEISYLWNILSRKTHS